MGTSTDWMPCSGNEAVDGLVWVKRLAQKAHRVLESRAAGTDLMNGYLFGDFDYIDGKVLKFLRTNGAAVLEVARAEPDDIFAARILIQESGRSADECREFSARLCKSMRNFALMEADEGRLPPSVRTFLLRSFYNALMMPIVYAFFRAAERRQKQA